MVRLSVTSDPDFKVMTFFEVEYLKDGASQGQSYYSILIGNHTNMTNGTMFGDL